MCSNNSKTLPNRCMTQYEKLDNYMEGLRRHLHLQDSEALTQYLLGGSQEMKRNSIEGTVANFVSEHASLMDPKNRFFQKKNTMPFETSPSVKVDIFG